MDELNNSPKKSHLYIFLIFVCVVLFSAVLYFFLILVPTLDESAPKASLSKEDSRKREVIFSDDHFVKSIAYSVEEKNKDALAELIAIENNYTAPPDSVILANAIAEQTLLIGDREDGSKRFARTYFNERYSSTTRGYAMLMVWLQYRSTRDAELFKPFFPDKPWDFYNWQDTLQLEVAQQIYALYPFTIVEAKIVLEQLLEFQNKQLAQSTRMPQKEFDAAVDKIMQKFDKNAQENILLLKQSQEMQHLLPRTYIEIGRLYTRIALGEVALSGKSADERAEEAFVRAITASRELEIPGMEQFAILNYADYFAFKKDFARAKEILGTLEKQSAKKLLSDSLKAPEARRTYRGLSALEQADKTVTYFKQFGW